MSTFQVNCKKTTVSDTLRSVVPQLTDLNETTSPPLEATQCFTEPQKLEQWVQNNMGKRTKIPKVKILFNAGPGFNGGIFGNPNLWLHFNYAIAAHVAGNDGNLKGFQQEFNCKVVFGDGGGGGGQKGGGDVGDAPPADAPPADPPAPPSDPPPDQPSQSS